MLRESCGELGSVAPPRTVRTWPLGKECMSCLKQYSPKYPLNAKFLEHHLSFRVGIQRPKGEEEEEEEGQQEGEEQRKGRKTRNAKGYLQLPN